MGTSLNGLTPANTYQALIKVGNNTNLNTTLKTLSDGAGNDLPMQASTAGVNFTGTLSQSGTAVPTAAEVAAKQDTLVSGTNIKTINGTSVLGSGNIAVVTSPSGVAGAIQFSAGSAFGSDAANLFWDDANNRLGVGTNVPTATEHIVGSSNTATDYALKVLNLRSQGSLSVTNDGHVQIGDFSGQGYGTFLSFIRPSGSTRATTFNQGNQNLSITNVNGGVIYQNTPVTVIGSGSTSATTSLLVQNSAGTAAFQIKDDMQVSLPSTATNNTLAIGGQVGTSKNGVGVGYTSGTSVAVRGGLFVNPNSDTVELYGSSNSIMSWVNGEVLFKNANNGATISNPSAIVTIDSTTKGFLPPRMTTTQKNAIASPATGLQVFDSTMNATCEYNGTGWRVVSAGAQSVSVTGALQGISFANGNVANIDMQSSTTFSFTNATIGTYILKITQGGAGGYVAFWPANVYWSGGTAPVLTGPIGKTDIITLVYDGTNYYGNYSLNY